MIFGKTTPSIIRILAVLPLFMAIGGPSCQGQIEKVDPLRESNFLYQVKIIDEFIERFNDDPGSALRKQYESAGKPINFNRRKLIESLFDSVMYVKQAVARKFIDQVIDANPPQKLAFYDDNWYAEMQFGFLNNGQKINIPIVLQISASDKTTIKWLIAGVGDHPVFRQDLKPAQQLPKHADTSLHSISAAAYGTDFRKLCDILKPGLNPALYFQPEVLASDRGRKFIQMLNNGQLIIQDNKPETLKFHFFQVPGYAFTVRRFLRNTNHSGWLISSLSVMDENQKRKNKGNLLQRSL